MKASENAEWLERLKARGFTADSVYDKGQNEDLKNLLLGYGGVAVVLPKIERDKKLIMVDGYAMVNPEIFQEKGDPCECHKNSAKIWKQYGYRLHTGYALSSDEVWRQHSWTVDNENVVHESTEPREVYFGFQLEEDEAEIFYEANV